jgi:hypothetical protein
MHRFVRSGEKKKKKKKRRKRRKGVGVYPCIRVKGNMGNFIFFNLLYIRSRLLGYNWVSNNSITGFRCLVLNIRYQTGYPELVDARLLFPGRLYPVRNYTPI